MAGILQPGGVVTETVSSFITPVTDIFLKGLKDGARQVALFANPYAYPGPEHLVQAFYTSKLTDYGLEGWMRQNGIVTGYLTDSNKTMDEQLDTRALSQIWQIIIDSKEPHLGIVEAMTLARRNPDNDSYLEKVLKLEGFRRPEERKMIRDLLNEIPGPSDLVHFTLRHGFEPDVIYQYRENEEFPKTSREWFAKQGLDYPIKIVSPIDGREYPNADYPNPITWADLYWWTHWVPISPSQAFEMLHRLRPDSIDRIREISPNAEVFRIKDAERWLRVNDYPPGVRANLLALSYSPLTRVDIRRMYNVGTLQLEELPGRYQDIGYAPSEAKLLAEFTRKQKDLSQIKPVAEATKSKVISLYETGAIARPQAAAQLFRLMILDPDKLDEYDTSPEAAQIAVAADNDYVNATLSFVDLEIKEKRLNRYLKIYKRSFMLGDLSAAVLEMNLQALMMQQWRIDQLVDEWSTELTSLRIPAATRKILEWAKQGLITLNDLDGRLFNLHYSAVDRGLFTAEVVKFVTDRQLKLTAEQQKAADKLAVQQAKEAARQQKAAAALAEKRQKAGEVAAAKAAAERRRILIAADRLATEKNIRSWWKDKLIDAEWVRARFAQLAVNPADIEMFIQELGPQS